MTAVARRPVLHLVRKDEPAPAPEPEPTKPAFRKWGRLAAPVDPAVSRDRAAWASFLTRDGERREASDLTDLPALARALAR